MKSLQAYQPLKQWHLFEAAATRQVQLLQCGEGGEGWQLLPLLTVSQVKSLQALQSLKRWQVFEAAAPIQS